MVKKQGAEPLTVEDQQTGAVGGNKVRGCDSRQKRLFVPFDGGGGLGSHPLRDRAVLGVCLEVSETWRRDKSGLMTPDASAPEKEKERSDLVKT